MKKKQIVISSKSTIPYKVLPNSDIYEVKPKITARKKQFAESWFVADYITSSHRVLISLWLSRDSRKRPFFVFMTGSMRASNIKPTLTHTHTQNVPKGDCWTQNKTYIYRGKQTFSVVLNLMFLGLWSKRIIR